MSSPITRKGPDVSQQDFIREYNAFKARVVKNERRIVSATAHNAQLRRLAAGSVGNNTLAVIPFDTTDIVSANYTVNLSTGLTVAVDGWYMVAGAVEFATNMVGMRWMTVLKNSVEYNSTRATIPAVSANGPCGLQLTPRLIPAVAGDVIGLGFLQNSGTTLGFNSAIMTVEYTPN